MILNRVEIRNFRSIKSLTFNFDPTFKILIGKNESGKSNIIRALSLLSDKVKATIDDKREFLPDEQVENEFYVRFIFKLSENEIKTIYQSIKKDFIIKESSKIISYFKTELTLYDFCKRMDEGLYRVELSNNNRTESYWSIADYYKFLPSIKRHKNYAKHREGEALTITNSFIVNTDEHKDLKKEDFVDVNFKELSTLIGAKIIDLVKKNRPDTILWQYDEANLLPNRININEFIGDPETCIPLRILFNLADYYNIEEVISESRKAKGNQFDNLLNRVSKKATKHFKEVWKEYPNISFSFTQNGEHIIASIQEENKYPLEQRSDGFKRFVTFLILISACAKNEELENTLLLFDEPDISLHPSGIRYLRDELKKVSKNNFIVTATHSIFMIDNDCIQRHLITTKNKEKTEVKITSGADIADEEVLYKAVGYSLYELLKEKNIIFEGWRDKVLYKTVIDNPPVKYKSLIKKLALYGYCQSNGVKGVKALTPIFDAINRKCIIITDDDDPARQRKSEYKDLHGIGPWKSYKEIDNNCPAITGEDFLKIEYLDRNLLKLKKLYPDLTGDPNFKIKPKGVMVCLDKWLSSQKSKDEIKPIINRFKELLFDSLTIKDIEMSYFRFLTKLQKEVEIL